MEKQLKQYELFFIKAKEDFNAAKYLLEGFNCHKLEIKLEIVFFHIQQAVEKLLKCILDINGIKFPKTHDIESLIELCDANNIALIDDINTLADLSDYAVEGRYAITHDDLSDVDKYLEITQNLFIFVKENLMEKLNG